jgi:GNAT superfamily N-acetyltransferase
MGLARRLMTTVIDWSRLNGVDRLILHASTDGRPLYESLGFDQTTEMVFKR